MLEPRFCRNNGRVNTAKNVQRNIPAGKRLLKTEPPSAGGGAAACFVAALLQSRSPFMHFLLLAFSRVWLHGFARSWLIRPSLPPAVLCTGLGKCSPSVKNISLVTRDRSIANVVSCVSISADCRRGLLSCRMWRSERLIARDQRRFADRLDREHAHPRRTSSCCGHLQQSSPNRDWGRHRDGKLS